MSISDDYSLPKISVNLHFFSNWGFSIFFPDKIKLCFFFLALIPGNTVIWKQKINRRIQIFISSKRSSSAPVFSPYFACCSLLISFAESDKNQCCFFFHFFFFFFDDDVDQKFRKLSLAAKQISANGIGEKKKPLSEYSGHFFFRF